MDVRTTADTSLPDRGCLQSLAAGADYVVEAGLPVRRRRVRGHGPDRPRPVGGGPRDTPAAAGGDGGPQEDS